MPVLPFSNHIGPGGGNPSGDPTNSVDALAKKHDENYLFAESEQDILSADNTFLEELALVNPKDPIEYIHKFAANLGISAKSFLERYTGVLYPQMAEINMGGPQVDRPDSSSGAGKKRKMETLKPESNTNESGNSLVIAVPRSKMSPKMTHSFKKTFFLEIVTFNPNLLTKVGTGNTHGYWTAPCYSFDVGSLGWYMNRGELNFINSMPSMDIKVGRITGDIKVATINSPYRRPGAFAGHC